MPGWVSHVLSWVQQFAEEEGLMLGVTLAGYALDLWLRLLHVSRSLERVQKAPSLGIPSLPAFVQQLQEALRQQQLQGEEQQQQREGQLQRAGQQQREGQQQGGKQMSYWRASSEQHSNAKDVPAAAERTTDSSFAASQKQLEPEKSSAARGGQSSSRSVQQESLLLNSVQECSSGIVIVRGRVQPSKDPKLWQILQGPSLLKAENASAHGVIYERIDKIVCSNLHQLTHNFSEHQVDVRRSQVPFELSEIPSKSSSSPLESHAPTLTPSIPSPSKLPFSSASPPNSIKVSLEGLTQPLPLVTVHSAFHRSNPSLTSVLLQMLTGSQPIGQKVEERLLLPGTDLTAVGEVKRDSEGRLTIAPSPDLPVFLTPLTKEQLVVHLSGTCTALFNTSVMFSAAAVATLGYVVYRRWEQRRRQERARRLVEDMAELERAQSRRQRDRQQQQQQQQQQEGVAAAANNPFPARVQQNGDAQGAPGSSMGVAEEAPEDLSGIGNGELCVVCLSRRRRAVFVPCGHLVCCWWCAQTIRIRGQQNGDGCVCPVCRGQLENVVRVYSS